MQYDEQMFRNRVSLHRAMTAAGASLSAIDWTETPTHLMDESLYTYGFTLSMGLLRVVAVYNRQRRVWISEAFVKHVGLTP